jgi:hypothetical protein
MTRAQFTRAELAAGVGPMLAARLQRYGTLDMSDAMAAFALIAHDGEITAGETRDIITALQEYQASQPAFSGFLRSLLEQLLASTSGIAPPAPAPVPTAAPPSADPLDPRLVGRWSYTSYYTAGTFSSTVNRVLVLQANGRFAEDGSASAMLKHVDSTGTWTGTTSAFGDGDPGERGVWTAADGLLRLTYDDRSRAEYRYETSGARGDRRLLTRGARGKEQFWVEF